MGDIRKRRAKGVGCNCQEKATDAQSLFPIILGEDGKMDKIDKSSLIHGGTI
jgi:hypothetical protein